MKNTQGASDAVMGIEEHGQSCLSLQQKKGTFLYALVPLTVLDEL